MLDEIQASLNKVRRIYEKLEEAIEELEGEINTYIGWEEERELEQCANAEERAD